MLNFGYHAGLTSQLACVAWPFGRGLGRKRGRGGEGRGEGPALNPPRILCFCVHERTQNAIGQTPVNHCSLTGEINFWCSSNLKSLEV